MTDPEPPLPVGMIVMVPTVARRSGENQRNAFTVDSLCTKSKVKRKHAAKRNQDVQVSDTEIQTTNVSENIANGSSAFGGTRTTQRKRRRWTSNQRSETNTTETSNKQEDSSFGTKRRITRNNSVGTKSAKTERLVKAKKVIASNPKSSDGKSIPESSPTVNETNVKRSLNFEITIDASKPTSESSVSSECILLTKDASISSTTTSVPLHTNDFVRLDNKLRIVNLTDINEKINKENKLMLDDKETSPESDVNFLSRDLPFSSPSPSSLYTDSESNDDSTFPEKKLVTLEDVLDGLETSFINFEAEITNWLGHDNENLSSDKQRIIDKFYHESKEESEIISHCQSIRKLLLEDQTNSDCRDEIDENVEVVNASISTDFHKANILIKHNNNNIDMNFVDDADKETKDQTDETSKVNCNNDYVDDEYNDDDDTLSLFAESITAFETIDTPKSVHDESNIRFIAFDEDVPQSFGKIQTSPTNTTTSHSVKTGSENINEVGAQNKLTKMISENLDANSTSIISKPQYDHTITCETLDNVNDVQVEERCTRTSDSNHNVNSDQAKPVLIASKFKPMLYIETVVFAGVCFYYLAYSCYKYKCRFPHATLDVQAVRERLLTLKEPMFIREYMLLRQSSSLRRLYGLSFVHECIRRNLTPVLIEMAIDYIKKATTKEDVTIKVEVVETILLHLSTVDLMEHKEFLLYKVDDETALCDCFVLSLAETLNFSRFKTVFINLTNFVCECNRQFDLNVAASLLERLSIFPYDEQLTLSLFNVLKRTSVDILKNPTIRLLENQLLTENKALYDQLQTHKETANLQPVRNTCVVSQNSKGQDVDCNNAYSMAPVDMQTRCSLDTAKLGTQNFPPPLLGYMCEMNSEINFGAPCSSFPPNHGPRYFRNMNPAKFTRGPVRPRFLQRTAPRPHLYRYPVFGGNRLNMPPPRFPPNFYL
ncbi:serine-rich adhesin for platelets-like [Battus philenor]|uniref:serine-rich adhesin for platelets-like n=1 Tax=Battus philenor TaxID=42288 RepID=UPI0035D06EE8